jgi:HlyD family secretion protein
MQILADVDESDIGQIQKGRPVTFTAPAYPDGAYDGVVREVRLQPITVQNVVTYTVVIDVINADGRLLPGMTATVDFVTGEVTNVLAVSTAALRLQVTPSMRNALANGEPTPPDAQPPGEGRASGAFVNTGTVDPPGRAPTMLWYLDGEEQLRAMLVQEGLSSNAFTEIKPIGPAESLVMPGFRVIEQELTKDETPGFEGPPGGGPPGGGR